MTYQAGTLKIPGGKPEYHMTQINTWGMTGNSKTFREGAAAFRNGRDWANEQREKAIADANKMANATAKGQKRVASAVNSSNPTRLYSYASQAVIQESQSSTDEWAYVDDAAGEESETAAGNVLYISQAIQGSQSSRDEVADANEATTQKSRIAAEKVFNLSRAAIDADADDVLYTSQAVFSGISSVSRWVCLRR